MLTRLTSIGWGENPHLFFFINLVIFNEYRAYNIVSTGKGTIKTLRRYCMESLRVKLNGMEIGDVIELGIYRFTKIAKYKFLSQDGFEYSTVEVLDFAE